jgi:hypothetical protein
MAGQRPIKTSLPASKRRDEQGLENGQSLCVDTTQPESDDRAEVVCAPQSQQKLASGQSLVLDVLVNSDRQTFENRSHRRDGPADPIGTLTAYLYAPQIRLVSHGRSRNLDDYAVTRERIEIKCLDRFRPLNNDVMGPFDPDCGAQRSPIPQGQEGPSGLDGATDDALRIGV